MPFDIAGSQVLSQPVTAFFQGRAVQMAHQEAQQRMSLLDAAEGRAQSAETRAREDQDNANREADVKYDEVNGKKALAGAQQVLALKKGERKAFVEKTFPDLIPNLEKQGYGKWDEIDEDEIEEMATGIAARASRDLGMGPAGPKREKVADGEIILEDGKQVFENKKEVAPPGPEKASWGEPKAMMINGQKKMVMFDNNGNMKTVEGAAPIDAAGDDKTFNKANVLRDEHNAQTKDYSTVKTSFSTIQALAKEPSAAGDIGLLTSYMRMIDPGSTVREGEFATAENAGGVGDKIRAKYNKLLEGERLSENQRTDFVKQAKTMFESRKTQYSEQRKRYTGLAERAGVDPLDVVGEEDQDGPVKVTSAADARKLPKGTQFVTPDGRTMVVR